MNKPTLIQISSELAEIYDDIAAHDGEISPHQEERLKSLLVQSEEKVSGYVTIMERLEQEQAFVKFRIEEAKKYNAKLEALQEKLKSTALAVIQARGEKLKGEMGHWIASRKSKSVVVQDQSAIPGQYMVSEIISKPDKKLIKEALEKGIEVPGCFMIENDNVVWR